MWVMTSRSASSGPLGMIRGPKLAYYRRPKPERQSV
jgi:hypothetical protein